MDEDSVLALEQAVQRLDSESSDSEVNVNGCAEPGGVVDASVSDIEVPVDTMYPNDQTLRMFRRFMMGQVIGNRKMNSLQNSGSEDSSSIASFSTDSDAGAKSAVFCHQARPANKSTRLAVSDTEGSRPRKSQRVHPEAYLKEGKPVSREEFALMVRERLLAVSKDRDGMTIKARDLLRQQGKTYDEIMSAQWYDLPETCKYLQMPSEMPRNAASIVSQSNGTLSPLEVRSPGSNPCNRGTPGHATPTTIMEDSMRDWHLTNHQVHRKHHSQRQTSACSSVFSATSDSGVGDTWATSDLTSPAANDRLHAYVQGQNFMAARLPERDRTAQAAAIALISNSPLPDSLSPLPGPAHPRSSERRHRNLGHYSSGDDSSSVFTVTSQSTTSDLFIPRRPTPHHPMYAADSDDQQHFTSSRGRRTLSTIKSSNKMKNSHASSPLAAEQHRQVPPSQQSHRPAHSSRGDTLIIYTLDELPTPFAKRLNGTDITLKDFKERVFARKGEYRFFFKSFCPDVNMELYEELSDDLAVLPLVGGKIDGRVEKITV